MRIEKRDQLSGCLAVISASPNGEWGGDRITGPMAMTRERELLDKVEGKNEIIP